MFIGIIEELEHVIQLKTIEDNVQLAVEASAVTQDVSLGDSANVSGCHLTVTAVHGSTFTADLMAETLARITLGSQTPGGPVSLEHILRAGDRLGRHIVQGHVGATVEVLGHHHGEYRDLLHIGLPQEIARYVAVKESVALNGVSLTVIDVVDASDVTPVPGAETSLSVRLTPETLRRTALGSRRPGERVNLEANVLAKYAERPLDARPSQEGQQAC